MTPHIAYNDALWMVSQTRAYSSTDGVTWREHAKTDWGERIYESIVYFKGRLWMYGGLDYQARTFLGTVTHNESAQIVGDVGLQHEDYGWGPVVGLGGRGNRQFGRKGLGLEAASATIAVGFAELGLSAIGAETRPENLPAQALLGKLGMRLAGTNAEGWPVFMITREQRSRTCQNPVEL